MRFVLSNTILTFSFLFSVFLIYSSLSFVFNSVLSDGSIYYSSLSSISNAVSSGVAVCEDLGFSSSLFLKVFLAPRILGSVLSLSSSGVLSLSDGHHVFSIFLPSSMNIVYVNSSVVVSSLSVSLYFRDVGGVVFVKVFSSG